MKRYKTYNGSARFGLYPGLYGLYETIKWASAKTKSRRRLWKRRMDRAKLLRINTLFDEEIADWMTEHPGGKVVILE